MPNYVPVPEAARLLPGAQRILVVGCSGGGKTTLSRRIADRFDLEYQSLDRDIRWLPGWTERDKSEQRAIVERLIRSERWVADGSGVSTFDLRLPRTDLVLWVRVPRRVALGGLARRILSNYGSVRFGMAEGCPERLPDPRLPLLYGISSGDMRRFSERPSTATVLKYPWQSSDPMARWRRYSRIGRRPHRLAFLPN